MRSSWKKKTTTVAKWPSIYEQINQKLGLNNIKLEEQPHLTISEWCHKHIKDLHKKYPKDEWLALCKVEKRWPGDFILTDMIHPEQTTSSWAVTATDKWMDWAVKELQERWEDMWLWNCVLHSHHWMGVFWSGTDDNARKDLNDWRFMAFAVVTAYKWSGDNIEVDYKWCLNFYKPYPIEIDCDMYYEEWYLDENYHKYIEEYNKLKEDIFESKVKERQEEINGLYTEPDYTRVLDYLWVDISKELKENYDEVVVRKMPNPQVETILKTCSNEAKEEAEEKMKEKKEIMEWMKEYVDWYKWSGDLESQLEDHIVKYSAPKYNGRWEYNKKLQQDNRFFWYDYDDDDELMEDDRLDSDFFFTSVRYPTSMSLRTEMGLRSDVSVLLENGKWKVYSKTQWKYVWADDFDYQADWDSCIDEDEYFTGDKEKKEKKENKKENKKEEKSDEEKAEDVLHWLYN